MTIPNFNSSGAKDRIKVNSVDIQEKNESEKQLQPVKEYSIEQFKKDYQEILNKRVFPEVAKYENERIKRLNCAIISSVICVLIGLYILFFTDLGRSTGEAAGLILTLAFLVWTAIQKNFEEKVKTKIMPILMKAVPGFYWQKTPPVKADEIQTTMLFPYLGNIRIFDDCFIGTYRKVPISISECHFLSRSRNSTINIFQGVVIKIKMNKSFSGITVVRPKNPPYGTNTLTDLKKAKLEEVKLEDPNFDKKFVVYSSDQIEARYLLTTSFMERFENLGQAFLSECAFCSFLGDSIYIAPHTGKDLFTLCSLTDSVMDKTQFKVLFAEFSSILTLVDYFKLDKKLGL